MGRITVPLYTPRYIPRGDERAIISTVKGDIVVEFEGNNAPLTVGNFVELAHKGFYNNLKFHAYQANSVILGGCPLFEDLGKRRNEVLRAVSSSRGFCLWYVS